MRYRSYRIAGTSGTAGTVRLWNGVAPTVHSTSDFFKFVILSDSVMITAVAGHSGR